MTDSRDERLERLRDLLADHELGRLDDAERAELDALLDAESRADGAHDFDAGLELEAAAEDLALTHAALVGPHQPLPEHLRRRVLAQAGRYYGWSEATVRPAPRPGPRGGDPSRGRSPVLLATGWLVAAAAALALVLVLAERGPAAPETLEDFVARATDEIVVDWAPTGDPLGEGVTGEVVWSPSEQRGFMRFKGLDRNDPTREQYQLWIIDAEREGEHPVDGGVFDCDDSGECVVPIDAKLPVGRPAAFAITLEKPGGVVVSAQEHLFLLAAVEG